MASKRVKTPPDTEADVLGRSRRRCPLCAYVDDDWREKKGQIAHLDQNPTNASFDNLVFLCLDHHSEYDSNTSQHKNYTLKELRRHRDQLYAEVADRIAGLSTGQPPLSTVPPHNERFVGRKTELADVREALHKGEVSAITAVHGFGGYGKSALAFEYAHRYAADYPGGRFLVKCAGAADLRETLLNVAEDVDFPLTPEQRADAGAYARLRLHLANGPLRLLVFDNVDNAELLKPATVAEIMPPLDRVHVLVTTRLPPADLHIRQAITVDILPIDDARELLTSARAPDNDTERDAIEEILKLLAGFTLAIEVVSVFLEQYPAISYADYAQRLAAEGLEAIDAAGQDERVELSRYYDKVLSFVVLQALDQLSPAEMLALEYAALLPSDQIPLPWLKTLVGQEHPQLAAEPKLGYPDAWAELVRRLFGLRLFTPGEADARVVRMHRLVQGVVTNRLGEARDQRLAAVVSVADDAAMALRKTWVQHAARWEIEPCLTFALQVIADDHGIAAAEVANSISAPLQELGRMDEAREMLRRARTVQEKALESGDPRLATTYNNLAGLEQHLGAPAEARRLLRRAITIQEQASERDAFALAGSYANLALVERELGYLADAKALLARAIQIWQMTPADNTLTLAKGYSNLALVEIELGDVDEARALFLLAIKTWKKKLPANHPTFATAYSNLALAERRLGHAKEAKRLLRCAIAIDERTRGSEHSSLATRWCNLALVEQDLGNLGKAKELLLRAVRIWERAFPIGHPIMANGYTPLACVEQDLGNPAEAKRLLGRAIEVLQPAYEADHPSLGTCYNNLSFVEWELGNHDEARRLMRQAYAIRLARLGAERPHTRSSRAWLEDHDPGFEQWAQEQGIDLSLVDEEIIPPQ